MRKADQDGNDKTQADLNWRSLLEAPPYPEYVSGHSVFSGSGAEILRLHLGNDQIAFSTNSDSLPGTLRHFESTSAYKATKDKLGPPHPILIRLLNQPRNDL